MSVSCTNYFDLLCDEETSATTDSSSDVFYDSSPSSDEESSIIGFIERERSFVPRSLNSSAREDSIAWTLKVQAYFGFQPLTAYLAVNYMDRFLDSRPLPQANGWPQQLLSVACLSLAAKMEEPFVPPLVDLQVEGAKYIFEAKTIRRMELLVLGALDWRLRSVTPFNFLSFFACKLDSTGAFTSFLISRATEIILSNIQEASFLAYWPSCIAAASILCAANETPNWAFVRPEHAESWCEGLRKEMIIGCYQFLREYVICNSQTKSSKVFPQLRVTTMLITKSFSMSSYSSSPSSSSSSSSPYKRRKLNNSLWVDDDDGDDKGHSE